MKNKKRIHIPKNEHECFKLLKPVFAEYKKNVEECLNFNDKESYASELLIVANNQIFCCDEFSCELYKDYASIGSGKSFALGSLVSNHKKEKSLIDALNAAIMCDIMCSGELVIKEVSIDG